MIDTLIHIFWAVVTTLAALLAFIGFCLAVATMLFRCPIRFGEADAEPIEHGPFPESSPTIERLAREGQ